MQICGVILAGGKSSRMGKNKALLDINGKPVIEIIKSELSTCTDQVIIISNQPEEYQFLQVPIYSDRYPGEGPLAGIESALYHVDTEWFFITACDMPFIQAEVFQYLYEQSSGYDAVVPIYEGQIHPLSSLYHRSVLPVIQQQLNKQQRQVKSFFDLICVNYVKDFNLPKTILDRHFFNMNRPEEYQQAKSISLQIDKS